MDKSSQTKSTLQLDHIIRAQASPIRPATHTDDVLIMTSHTSFLHTFVRADLLNGWTYAIVILGALMRGARGLPNPTTHTTPMRAFSIEQ